MIYAGSMFFMLLPLLFGTPTSGNTPAKRQTIPGDKQCGSLMCVSAVVNGQNTEYVLSSTGKNPVGWMAIGFGSQMPNTPMVIMWSNAGGDVTLSQRIAPAHIMPTLDTRPPRVAALSNSLTSPSGSTPSFGFTIPTNGDTAQSVIYAFGSTPPSSSAPDASLVQHLEKGVFTLDLTKNLLPSTTSAPSSASNSGAISPSLSPSISATSSASNSASSTISGSSPALLLLSYQFPIVAQVVFYLVGSLPL